jgi:hypothetical protein
VLFQSLGINVLAVLVPQSSQAICSILALLALGKRFPHVVQKSSPLNAMVSRLRFSGVTIVRLLLLAHQESH